MLDNSPRFKIKKISQRSKASRICYLFKPNEPVGGEEFDLGLTIINLTQETYNNGYISCTVKYPNIMPIELRFSFDAIKPNEEKELWLINQTASSSGIVLLHDFNLISEGKLVARGDNISGSTIPCHSFINSMDQAIDKVNPLIFSVSSRGELYQKYSVVVAIWTAVISIIISTIAVLLHLS